jgi:hypothetical protein
MPTANAMDVFHFLMIGIQSEPEAYSQAMAFFSTFFDFTTRDPLGQYFLARYQQVWFSMLDTKLRTDEDICAAAKVFEGLVYLHYLHDQELMQIGIVSRIVGIILNSSHKVSIQIKGDLMDVLGAVCQNPYLTHQLRKMLSPSALFALISTADLSTMRGSFALFHSLYLPLLPSCVTCPNLHKSVEAYSYYQQYLLNHDAFTDYLLPLLQLCMEKYMTELKKIAKFVPPENKEKLLISPRSLDERDPSSSNSVTDTEDIDGALADLLKLAVDPKNEIVMSALTAVATSMGHVNYVFRALANAGHFAVVVTDNSAIFPSPRTSITLSTDSLALNGTVPPGKTSTSTANGPQVPLLENVVPGIGKLRRTVISLLVTILGYDGEAIPPCLEGIILRKLTNTLSHLRGYVETCWKFRFFDEELADHAQQIFLAADNNNSNSMLVEEGGVGSNGETVSPASSASLSLVDPAILSTSPGKTFTAGLTQRRMSLGSEPSSSNSINVSRKNSSASEASSANPRTGVEIIAAPATAPMANGYSTWRRSSSEDKGLGLDLSKLTKSKTTLALESRGMHRAMAACLGKYVDNNAPTLLGQWSSLAVDKKFVHVALLSLINVAAGIDVLDEVFNLKSLAERVYGVFKDHTEYGLEQQCGQLITSILIFLKNKQRSSQLMSALLTPSSGPSPINSSRNQQQMLLKKRFVSRGRQGSSAPQVEPVTITFLKPCCDLIISRLSSPVNAKNDSMLYIYVSMLTALCYHDLVARKIVIQSFLKIFSVFWSSLRHQCCLPLLLLLMHAADSMVRVEGGATVGMAANDVYDREDCFTGLVVYALRCAYGQSYVPSFAACSTISYMGTYFPNIAKRIFAKREVESCLFGLILKSRRCLDDGLDISNTSDEMHSGSFRTLVTGAVPARNTVVRRLFPYPQLTYLALRGCVVCMRLLTLKCNWDVSEYSFSLSSFRSELGLRRPLLCEETIDIFIELSSRADLSYRLLILIACLEACTALRLNCRPSDQQSQAELDFFCTLKQKMVNRVLILLPRVLSILIHKRNIITVNIRMPRAKDKSLASMVSQGSGFHHSGESGSDTDLPSMVQDKDKSSSSPRFPVASRFPVLRSIMNRASPPPTDKKSSSPRQGGGSPRVAVASKPSPIKSKSSASDQGIHRGPETISSSSSNRITNNTAYDVSDVDHHRTASGNCLIAFDDDPIINPVLEQLTETAVEAMYAFFCLDGTIPVPMVTFASNSHLFAETPIYYMLEYSMLCFPDNSIIQCRGVEIFQCFAENNINLYSLTIHASIVLMIAFETFNESSEMYIAFAKLVLCIVSHSESIREKLVRYGVQDGLSRILLGFSVDAALMSLQALQLLCLNEDDAAAVMEGNVAIFSNVLRALDHFTTDHRIQIEGLRFVLAICTTQEYLSKANAPHTVTVLKKSRKVLLQILEQKSLASGYRYADIHTILKNDVLPKADGEKCVIS